MSISLSNLQNDERRIAPPGCRQSCVPAGRPGYMPPVVSRK